MTRFRTVVFTVAVAAFALALGIAVGAGPLQDDMHDAFNGGPATPAKADADLRRQESALKRTIQYDEDAVHALAPGLLANRLASRPVVVLALPGADKADVKVVVDDISAAGGTLTGQLTIGSELVDPSARTLVDTLSAGQVKEYDDLEIRKGAGVYERVGQVVARAVATGHEAGAPTDDGARSVLNGLTTAGLVRGAPPDQRASLVVFVAGADGGDADIDTARARIIATLAAQFRKRSDGVVVAGPPGSAAPGGAVHGVRADAAAAKAVSTVDTLDSRLGQVAVIRALAQQASGTAGHYGVVDAPDGAMPQ